MNCIDFKSQLEQKEENELLSPEALKHATVCVSWRELYRDLDRVWSLMADWKGIDPSPWFQQRFWKAVKKETPRNPGWLAWILPEAWLRLRHPALVSGLILACLVVGGFLAIHYRSFQSSSTTPIAQSPDDDLLLERLDSTSSNPEGIEALEAFDAWILIGEESPSMNPMDESSPNSEPSRKNTFIHEESHRA